MLGSLDAAPSLEGGGNGLFAFETASPFRSAKPGECRRLSPRQKGCRILRHLLLPPSLFFLELKSLGLTFQFGRLLL
jgi:hypothetical protein